MSNLDDKSNSSQSLLVVGNGCDMFLGLSSSFRDFFGFSNPYNGTYYSLYNDIKKFNNLCKNFDKQYKDTHSDYQYSGNIKQITSHLIIKYIDVKDIRQLLGENKFNFRYRGNMLDKNDLFLLNEYTKKFNKYLYDKRFTFTNCQHINFWAIYLILRKYDKDVAWSAIESEMHTFFSHQNFSFYEILSLLFSIINSKDFNFVSGQKPALSSNEQDVQRFELKHKNTYTINDLIQFIKGSQINIKYDYNCCLLIYIFLCNNIKKLRNIFLMNDSDELYNHLKRNYPSIYKAIKYVKLHGMRNVNFNYLLSLSCDYLKRQLSKFEHDLNDYLSNCLNRYSKLYNLSYNNIGENLFEYMSSNKPFSLLDFNYTNPLIHKNKINDSLMHYSRNIHGILMNKSNYVRTHSLIIGMGNQNISISDPGYIFTKDYRVLMLSPNDYGNIFYENRSIKYIKFFGHSFNDADCAYFFDIFDHFDITNVHKDTKFIFYYVPYGSLTDGQCAVNQINKINRLFYRYCKDRKLHIDSRRLVHNLSFEGRLIISNLQQDINNDTKYTTLNRDLNKVRQIQSILLDLRNGIENKNIEDIRQDINELIKYSNESDYLKKCNKEIGEYDKEINKYISSNKISLKSSIKFITNLKDKAINVAYKVLY